jgi:GDPmannose 4,6-dehydratase
LANIFVGLEKCLYLGNMDSLRDWGHAKDYVRMQWMMLQQDKPEDYVIATGVQYSIRDFIHMASSELGIEVEFEGKGKDEIGVIKKINDKKATNLLEGDIIIKVDEAYFRPTEVESLLGDPSKAKKELGWMPEISTQEMCSEMVREDLKIAKLTSHNKIFLNNDA